MEIYAKGKTISTHSFGSLFTQGEHFADVIHIIVDRYYCGKDLSLCTFVLRGITAENQETEQLLTQEVTDTKIRLTWHVTENFTQSSGRLLLELRASETIDDHNYMVIKYHMQPVTVRPTLS